MHRRLFPFVLALLIAPGLALAQQKAKEAPKWKMAVFKLPESVELHEGVECSHPGDFTVLLNVYVPKKDGPHPGILLIHGGGWQKRQIDADKPLAAKLAERGFVVAQVAYRLSTDAKYPGALHDCKAALRFLRAHAAQYKLDVDRVGVMGGSAGGHLSGLIGMTGGKKALEGTGGSPEQSTVVKACVVMAATMDMVTSNKEKNGEAQILFFGPFAEKQSVYAEASPLTHVSKTSPPTLFIEGEKDNFKVGRPEMQEHLRGYGVPTELVTLKDAPHPFWMSQPWLDETVKAAGDWFAKYLE